MPGTTLHQAPAEIAKATLRRLALSKLEPTPENYAQAWAQETGRPAIALANAKGRPIFEKLVGRLFDEAGPREDLLEALMRNEWETARRLVERAADHQVGQSQAWAQTLEKLARGLERGGRQWTSARKKDSLQRVLDGNRSDSIRLQQRLKQLVTSWEGDVPEEAAAAEGPPARGDGSAAEPS
ncbi:MAG TPA: GGDEF domain-containing protein, partial [Burkholderiaceae bacterium]|nr:GGDEF domain-containing protein [Burkholderiaceae bacterium]